MNSTFTTSVRMKGIGTICVEGTSRGITAISLTGNKRSTNKTSQTSTTQIKSLINKLDAFTSGKKIDFKAPLDISGTPFQLRVWKAIASIPWGETRSYKWVATKAGNAKACRAAAQACGANPVPIVIPCHRVIASDGSIGGFSGGLALKRKLLKIEGTVIRDQ